ncbi:hypothetical protein N9W09_03110, partial [Crocinitomicaceae bacterium]|nr:hypothetical protein [Crocinitomicaceae bacterium]
IKEKKNNLLIDSIKNYLALAKHNREKILREDYGVPILTKCTKIGIDIIDRCIPSLIQIKESYGFTHYLTQNIYNEVFSEVNLCCVTAANKFGEQYHDNHDQLNFIKTAGRTCHKCYIDLLQSCQIHVSDLRIPIKGTIEKNIEVMKNSYGNWQQLYDNALREEERERLAEIELQRRARQRREQEKRDRIRRERERIERAERERKERIRREKQKEKEDREFAIIIGALILGAIILFALFGWTALIIILVIIGIFAGGR